jgi:hypothetical protein
VSIFVIVAASVGFLAGIIAAGVTFSLLRRERAQQEKDRHLRDDALQAYLDEMAQLLLERNLGDLEDPYDATRVVARARTLAILKLLDASQKRAVVQFLYDANLINGVGPVVSLMAADLEKSDLSSTTLAGVNLEGAFLKNANLRLAILSNANLEQAALTEADLSRANPSGANLRNADLSGANMRDFNLSEAYLTGVTGVTSEVLERAISLRDATMPNGQKYEDWLNTP